MKIFWWLPTQGDGRYIGTKIGNRKIDFRYLTQIAQATDMLGYHGILVPTGRSCEDPWITSSALSLLTKRLKFLIAVRPSVMSPTVAARMSASFDKISDGRLLINVVTGGVPSELAADGVFVEHDKRYDHTNEFLDVWKNVMEGNSYSFDGEYIKVKNAELIFPGIQKPYPPIYFGGASDSAMEVATKHSNTYLMWGEPLEDIKYRIAKLRSKEAENGRKVKIGIRFHVIVRKTTEEAYQAANDLIKYVDIKNESNIEKIKGDYDSEGQRRQSSIIKNNTSDFLKDNLWSGIGRVRSGAGITIVGNPDQVAETLLKYKSLGIDEFILSGYPHLEEAYRVSELLFPLLPINNGEEDNKSNIHGEKIAWF